VRVRLAVSDERGATAVMTFFLLVVLIGMLALSIDGGLLWTKFREARRANDAAAIAAALECGTSHNEAAANTSADAIASGNASDMKGVPGSAPGATNGYNAYSPSCGAGKGTVTVHYGSTVATGGGVKLMFWPAVCALLPGCNVDSKDVGASATAVWGAAGGGPIFPLTLSMDALTSPDCLIPSGMTDADVGVKRCAFYFHACNGNNCSFDVRSTWGLIDLDTWTTTWDGQSNPCTSEGNPSTAAYPPWYENPQTKSLNDDPMADPSRVCLAPGAKKTLYEINPAGNNPNQVLAAAVKCSVEGTYCPQSGPRDSYSFPVNDPSRRVDFSAGAGQVLFAIVGFASLKPVNLCEGSNTGGWNCTEDGTFAGDTALCDKVLQSLGAANDAGTKCLVGEWEGYKTSNVDPISGNSFGNLISAKLVGCDPNTPGCTNP
jgi:Flp pilus assembly protein TadG